MVTAARIAPTPALTAGPPVEKPKRIPRLKGGHGPMGHLPLMAEDPLALIERIREELGDIGAIRAGHKRVVFVADPAAVERILVDNVRAYRKQTRGYQQLRKMLGNGLVTSEGSFWLRQRRIAQPAFHREKLTGIAAVMERDTREMIARWRTGKETREAFDFSSEMMKLTMRIIGEVLFSVDVSGESDAAGAAVNELVHQAMARTVDPLQAPMFLPTAMNRRFKNAKRTLDELVLGIIEARRRGEDKPDLLSMLLTAVDTETGEAMSNEQVRDEVLTLFAAGHETTSTSVSWTLHLLLDHPDVLARLIEEIGSAPVTIERAMRMPLLDAVMKESMRLYPPVWMVARSVEEDDVLAGFQVKKGDMLFAPQWGIHRHPKLWKDATKFVPERFLVEDPTRAKYAYFPFIGGPRKCIGDQLAILETKIIVASLMQSMTFSRAPGAGREVVPDPAITLRMKNGLWVTAAPR